MSRTRKDEDNKSQRAIIFQGGAALGAYEAGVYKELYDWIKKDIKDDENVFDIVAGTSVGAINASIIVSHVKENRKKGLGIAQSWDGSVEVLERFWIDMSTKSLVETFPGFSFPWIFYFSDVISIYKKLWGQILNDWKSQTALISYLKDWFNFLSYYVNEYLDTPASEEAARRYYSVKEFQRRGANNVFSPLPFALPDSFWPFKFIPPTAAIPKLDFRFYDNTSNLLFRYTNQPLRNVLERYVNFPIATSYFRDDDDNNNNNDQEIKEPRLLIVAVDVQEGATVTFDSYPATECKICKDKDLGIRSNKELIKHLYDKHRKKDYPIGEDDGALRWSVFRTNRGNPNAIFYEGIKVDHVLACASVPIVYDYTTIEAEELDGSNNKILHYFWDGQYLSNTPLRELISEHTIYWKNEIGTEKLREEIFNKEQDGLKVPDLDVYIVNLWPIKENDVAKDHDGQVDRKNDILYHDKTEYDEKVAELVTDYIDLAKELLVELDKHVPREQIRKNILEKKAHSRLRTGKIRTYNDLLVGKFALQKVIRIERTDDPDAISEKWGDYSYGSIQKLFEQGRKDTLRAIMQEEERTNQSARPYKGRA
jgi:NTE family protein